MNIVSIDGFQSIWKSWDQGSFLKYLYWGTNIPWNPNTVLLCFSRFLTTKYHLDFSKNTFGKRCYQSTKGNIEEPDAWLRVSAMVDPLLGWRGSGWWPGGFLVCSAPSGGRQSGHHHSSAQVGRGGTARRPLAVLSLLIAASRMARYQVTKMSAPAVQIADRFLRRGDHLWQAVVWEWSYRETPI